MPVPAPSAPTIESEPLGNIHEIPTRVVRQMPDVPKDLLKTAPGTPGFGQRPVARPAPAMAAPRPAAKPAPPPVDEPVPTSGEYAAAEGDEAAAAAAPEPSPPVAKPAKAARVRPNARAASPEYEVVARPASLFRRLVSWVIDSVVITAVVGGMLAVAVLVISPTGLQAARLALLEKVAMPAAALSVLIAFVYTALFAFLWQGRTFGRRLLGIHLVDGTGSAPGPVRAVIRALLSVVSFALFLAGFWLALFDRKGQTLHDKLSRTFVVRLGADAS